MTPKPERLNDPEHPHVIAALAVVCPACKAKQGEHCGWWRGSSPRRWKIKTGIVHHIRIPEDVLFGGAA